MEKEIGRTGKHLAAWRSHFHDTIINVLGYRPRYTNSDVYIKERTRNNGSKYCSYMLLYMDNELCNNEDPKMMIHHIASIYIVKDNSSRELSRFLSMNIRKWVLYSSIA